MKRFALLCCLAGSIALTGCGAVNSVKDQVSRETFAPKAATIDNVSIQVYLDRSGSAKPLREDISNQLLSLLDLYPAAVNTTFHWYSQDCIKINSTVSSLSNLTPIMDAYVSDTNNDDKGVKGTKLVSAFQDLQKQAARDSGKQVIAVFVTDGGFEDDHSLLGKETDVLRDIPNISTLIFVGLDADGTKKLTVLDDVVRDRFVMGAGGEPQKQFFDVTLKSGGPMLAQAKSAIEAQVATTR